MRTLRILWKNIFASSKVLFLLLVISSSVYAFAIVPMWLQKLYLEKVDLFLAGKVTISTLVTFLVILYLARSITGGFLIPFGHAKDLYYEYVITRNVFQSQHQINNKIHLEYYETASVFNLIERAKKALTSGALRETVNTLGSILTLVFSLLAMIGSLYLLNPIFALISMVSIIPIFVEQLIFADQFFKMSRRITEKKRKQEQCIKHIIGKEYYLETRLAGAASHFQAKWERYRQEIEADEMRLHWRKLRFELLFNLVKSVSVVAIIVIASMQMSQGQISIGGFSAVISILGVMHASTGYFISQVSSMYAQYKELTDVVEYYELNQDQADTGSTLTTIDSIRLDQLSFKYPGRDTWAVKGIDKQFHRGEKVAILGANGAGKTTLVNLILGLYKPTEGRVMYGEVDAQQVNKPALYKKMSAVFQNFAMYNLTIKENVIFGQLNRNHAEEQVDQALRLAGFNYGKYEKGAETRLGKEFQGIELSRGEAQQVAIARSYYNQEADVIVIDEPTAALDPIAEERLYQQFLEIAGEKTTFFISHRLGSVRIADRILVMDSAEIIEDGSHEELLSQDGVYAQMYREQAALYDR